MSQENNYIILDSRDAPVAKGILENPRDPSPMQILILDGQISDVMRHESVRLVPLSGGPAVLGRIIRSRGDRVIVEKVQVMDSELRQNLRVPVDFRTFIYPITGTWKGRREVEANDLSCGGIAFYSVKELKERERMEIVVPITSQPLILRCEILRRRPSDREDAGLYAAKFYDLCRDEDTMVCEAVFGVQLRGRAR